MMMMIGRERERQSFEISRPPNFVNDFLKRLLLPTIIMGKKSLVRSKERPTERDERRQKCDGRSSMMRCVYEYAPNVCVENVKKMWCINKCVKKKIQQEFTMMIIKLRMFAFPILEIYIFAFQVVAKLNNIDFVNTQELKKVYSMLYFCYDDRFAEYY